MTPDGVRPADPPAAFLAYFERLAYALYPLVQERNGPVILHFAQGCPNHIELPGDSVKFPLDKGRKSAHS